jgi:hypothetical protein
VKLSSALVERTLDQFEARPLPENHPAIATLSKVFGEHTFFINNKGQNIVRQRSVTIPARS